MSAWTKTAMLVVALGAALTLDASTSSAAGSDALDRAARAEEHTVSLDFDAARDALAGADPESVAVAIEKGRLAIYEGRFDDAVRALSRPDVLKTSEGAELADNARGSARATAATVLNEDDAAAIEIRYQDEHDRALTPLVVRTVVAAREQLTRDLGVTWPKPTRIVVVRDLLTLSAMTGLPYDSARTTGTVAVAKWGRVTILSPRASDHGYPWRDTLAHELTHLAVTRATSDRAPLWLQEGLAKREETRWRPPGPFDGKPSPESIVRRGIALKLDLPLDKLGPSIAMLPSADAAMVAFAEVTSFVRHLAETAPADALPRLLLALREKKSVDDALREATGNDLAGWDVVWRAAITKGAAEPLPALFALGAPVKGARELRERTRLAELLVGRSASNAPAAAMELAHLPESAFTAPSVRYVKMRVLEAEKKNAEAEALADPADVVASFAPFWAIRGRLARAPGDSARADPSFVEAVALDPFDVEGACESLGEPAADAQSPTPPPQASVDADAGANASANPQNDAHRSTTDRSPLCAAAEAAEEPPLGRD